MIGIDLRVTVVKVVEVEKLDNGPVIKNWGMDEVPFELLDKHPQLEEAKTAVLKQLVQSKKIKGTEAVLVVGGPETFVKLFTIPQLSQEETAQAINWKFAEEIPYPIESALVDYYPLPNSDPAGGKIDYVAACISKKMYLEAQSIISRAGLKLVGITILPEALQALYHPDLTGEGNKIASIIYMGKRSTNISLFRNGNFEFNRELAIGGETITQAMSGQFMTDAGQVEITSAEAEKLKTENGIPIETVNYPNIKDIPATQLQAMVRPALEKIQAEISRTFEYYKGQTGEGTINKIIFTGGSTLTPNLKEFIGDGLGIPLTLPTTQPNLDPRLSAAVGATQADLSKINLLPEEVKHHWKVLMQTYLQPRYLIGLLVILFTLIYLAFFLRLTMLNSETKQLKEKLAVLAPSLARLNSIEQASREEEKKRLALKDFTFRSTRLPVIMIEISRQMPGNAFLTTLNLTPSSLHIWGTAFESGDTAENTLSRFMLALANSPYLSNLALVQATKNNEYNLDALNFEITGMIKE